MAHIQNKLNNTPIFFYRYLCDLKYHLVIENAPCKNGIVGLRTVNQLIYPAAG
jgi:hypothetical protein